ncbi:hypothetical protein ACFL9T_05135 [Thermodesulfobacteriota bacterium]
MKEIDNNQIEKLLEDISSIKSVINRNKPLLQQVLIPEQHRLLASIGGLSIIFFSMFIYFLMDHFGSFGDIPRTIRYILYGAIAADFIFIQIIKRSSLLASAKKYDQSITYWQLFKEFLTIRIIHIYIPLLLLMIFLIIYFIYQNAAYYIVPTLSIGAGLLYNFIGCITEIRQYLLFGYWLLITGTCTIILSFIPALVAVSVIFGIGWFIFAFSGALFTASDREDD